MKRRILRRRLLEIHAGFLAAPEREPRLAEPEQRKGIVAPKRERAEETRFCGCVVSTREQEVAEVRMRFRQRGIECQRSLELRGREIGLGETPVGDRQMAAKGRLPGIQLDGAKQRLQGSPGIPELQSQDADGVQRVRVVRQGRLDDLERRGGSLAVPGLERFERAREDPAVEARLPQRQR